MMPSVTTGAVKQQYTYTAYGVITGVSSSLKNRTPFLYGGEMGYYTDGNAAGVVLCTYRWYSPDMGRWLSRDPISYEGGHNLYGYCGGNPVGGWDPDGHLVEFIRVGAFTHWYLRVTDKKGNIQSIGFYADPDDGPWWEQLNDDILGTDGMFEINDDFDHNSKVTRTVIDFSIDDNVTTRLEEFIDQVKRWRKCKNHYHAKERYNLFNRPKDDCYGAALKIYKSAIHQKPFPFHEYYPDPPSLKLPGLVPILILELPLPPVWLG